MITPAQCRAREASLIGAQQELAGTLRALGSLTVRQFEAGCSGILVSATLAVLRQAFETAGIEFIDENGGGPGVRLRKRQRLRKPK